MFGIDKDLLKHSIVLEAENDGVSYRHNKNAKLAVNFAIMEHIERFKDLMNELEAEMIQEVNESWNEE